MSEHTLSLLESIRARLRATVRRVTLAEAAFGAVLVVGLVAAVALTLIVLEASLWMSSGMRTGAFWALVTFAAALGVVFVVLPLLRMAGWLPGATEEEIAQRIGERYPEVSDRLVNLLDLVDGRRSDAPSPLLDGAVRMLGEQVHPVPFEQVERFERARRASRLASLPLVGLLVFGLAAPSTFIGAAARLFSPGAEFLRPAPFQLTVTPGTTQLLRGEALTLAVEAQGSELPEEVRLAVNNLDEEVIETIRLTADSTGTFHHTVVNVRKPLRYRVEAAPVTTSWYTVDVVERPIVRTLRTTLSFPRYTRIPPQRLAPNVGDVTALPGTSVDLEIGLAGADIEAAYVAFDDGARDTLTIEGDEATGAFTLRREGSYQIQLVNAAGITNEAPIDYRMRLLSDAYPSIVLVAPTADAVLDESLRAGLLMRLVDDFGFARLRLYYRLAESRFGEPQADFSPIDLDLESPRQLDQEIGYLWNVRQTTGLDLVPGDVVEYYVQVWDNDSYAGYKTAQSAVQRLRLPSLAEQYEQLDAEQDAAEESLGEMLDDTEEIEEQFQELRDELRRKQQADWEDERQLEQLQERQQQMEERVDDLTQQMQQMTRQMEQNDLVNDETLEMYQELQKVIEEINSPELQEALRELQEAMQDLNLEQMQEALQDFEFSEEQYQQRLERALELFKKLRIQQKLDETARRLEELAKQQEQLAQDTEQLKEQQGDPNEQGQPQEEQQNEGEHAEGEQAEGEQSEGQQDGEQSEGEQSEGEQAEGEQQEGQQNEGQQAEGEQQEGEQSESPQNEGQQQEPQDGEPRSQESLAKQQELNREEMERVLEEMEKIRQQMQESQGSPEQEMQQLQQDAQEMPQEMQENAEQLRQDQLDQAQQQQQQMQQQLQQMQQQLQNMQQGMQGQQQQINMAGVRRALEDILTLSQQQESLRGQVQGLSSDSPMLRDLAQEQVALSEGLTVVSDSLQKLARDIPQMNREVQQQAGDALREMGSATESLAERTAGRASGYQKGSMMHLNELAVLLSELLNQMMSGSGSGGGMSMQQMMQQMQQMGQQQQQLNQQIQQMLNDMQGNRLSTDAQQRLQQMAEQQQQIRQQLRELSRNREARGSLLGDLNRIAEEMQETIEELQRRQVDDRTVERQQRILSRLLDAQKSMQQRGEERRREGREFLDLLDRESPPELTPTEQAEQLRRALIRALESGYAPDYEELIKRYFELLQEQEDGGSAN